MSHFNLVQLLKDPSIFLRDFFHHYGGWAYVILFLIVFCETGLVVTPFLPGDSLLFAAGLMANRGVMNPLVLCLVLVVAALCGDNTNYFLGCKLGRRLFKNEKSKVFNKRSLDRTHAFFEKYGGRTVIVARFLPVFRTFAPFVAGMAKMEYHFFILYSVIAATLWVTLCVTIGYSVGSAPWAKDHFSLILLALIFVSAIPGLFEIARHMRANRKGEAPDLSQGLSAGNVETVSSREKEE